MAGAQRLSAAYEERPAAPKHHGRRQYELGQSRQPRCDSGVNPNSAPPISMTTTGNAKPSRNPEPPRHVGEFAAIVAAPPASGSSAMPQIGQAPGRPGGFRDAWGRCRSRRRPARAARRGLRRCALSPDIFPGRRRTCAAAGATEVIAVAADTSWRWGLRRRIDLSCRRPDRWRLAPSP